MGEEPVTIEQVTTVAPEVPEISGKIQDETIPTEESIRDEKGRIKPGFSLNPAGKPKGIKHYKTLYMEVMKEIGAKNSRGEDISNDLVIVKKLFDKAKAGDLKAIDMIVSRVDGDKEDEAPPLQMNVILLGEEEKKKLLELL
jgi:hypothetical protein